MKYSTVLIAAAFAAGASAQVTRADFPTCALECLQKAIASETDCSVTDIACSCEPANNKKVTAAATPCVLSACEGADITKTLQVSGAICAPGNDAGGEAPASSSAEEEAPASTSTKVEETTVAEVTSTSTATTSAAAEETSAAEETTDVGAPSTVYVTVCDSSSTKAPEAPKPTGNATAPVEPPTFTGAAGKIGATLGSVAAFALAALAL